MLLRPVRHAHYVFDYVFGHKNSPPGVVPDELSCCYVTKWALQDLNLRPTDYESAALTN